MARKRYSPEQIIVMLREADVLESKGLTLLEIANFNLNFLFFSVSNNSYFFAVSGRRQCDLITKLANFAHLFSLIANYNVPLQNSRFCSW
jgi:hypothetical protein